MQVRVMSFYSPIFRPFSRLNTWTGLACIFAVITVLSACTSSENLVAHQITVEGRTVFMGNVPFEELILKTEDQNSYLLKMDRAMLDGLQTPAQLLVTGILSRGDWNGRAFAQIQVLKMVRVEGP